MMSSVALRLAVVLFAKREMQGLSRIYVIIKHALQRVAIIKLGLFVFGIALSVLKVDIYPSACRKYSS